VKTLANPLVSIIINNYNYGRFLRNAIEGAIKQDYAPTEILVVDDGSTDDSHEIIGEFSDAIIPIFKENGGQASALNAGIAASKGEIICFLDADDCFYSGKVRSVVKTYLEEGLYHKPVLVHHRLTVTNSNGDSANGAVIGRMHKSPLNLYEYARRYKSILYEAGPTSGLSVNRILADRLFPIPEKGIISSADDFIVKGASLIGELYAMEDILGNYRAHGQNLWYLSASRKSPDFIETLDAYLNAKLEGKGLSPVLSFNDSMHAWGDLAADRRWLELFRQMVRVSIRQLDWPTAYYGYRVVRTIAGMHFKAVVSSLRRSYSMPKKGN